MITALFVLIAFVALVFAFMQQARFGKQPTGERLVRIKKSPNYKNGSFQNLNHTPPLAEGVTYFKMFKEVFFDKKERVKPIDKIPSTKTDLHNLDRKQDVLVWFGHSSYFMQIDGKRILVDPVLSGHASPFTFSIKAFEGADVYKTDDIPEIDYLFISHDHWDHLDYKAIKALKPKIKMVICSLGVGEHLEHWGYNPDIIIEKDWHEKFELDNGFTVNTTPARHFSGRTFKRNQSLWTSFVFQTPTMKIFIGGDSGYDTHFAEIGKNHGPFDLAILENGQYDRKWRYIHTLPDELLQVAKDIGANRVLPVHSSKFALAAHAWDEPLSKIIENNKKENLSIITPMIGEQVNLKNNNQQFTEWWKGVK
ncbi:MAG TPA: MBL fold metallo-hydrolase [Bacteroidia bacterium]|nr:MBL fold metallo-hydrolase [Bacteroidia bacterium]